MSEKKFSIPAAIASIAAIMFMPSASHGEVLGPDAPDCFSSSDTPSALVRVSGFKTRKGTVRVQAYGSKPADFLEKGKWVSRVDLPVSSDGYMDVCLPLPRPGRYAIAIRHDANANGKSDWNDGGGFSRNPKLSLFRLEPKYEDVAIPVGRGPASVSIVLNYRRGLSIGPI